MRPGVPLRRTGPSVSLRGSPGPLPSPATFHTWRAPSGVTNRPLSQRAWDQGVWDQRQVRVTPARVNWSLMAPWRVASVSTAQPLDFVVLDRHRCHLRHRCGPAPARGAGRGAGLPDRSGAPHYGVGENTRRGLPAPIGVRPDNDARQTSRTRRVWHSSSCRAPKRPRPCRTRRPLVARIRPGDTPVFHTRLAEPVHGVESVDRRGVAVTRWQC